MSFAHFIVAFLAHSGIVLVTSSPTPAPGECEGQWCELRIPRDVYLPVKYDLKLEPDLEAEEDNTYNGTVTVTIDVLKPTSVLTIHIKYLDVTSTALSGDNEVDEAFAYEPNQFWVVKTKSALKVGTVDLTLEFKGSLTNGIVGYYLSTYKDATGKVHPLATSKFEPSDARKAFPCFDEPNLKANFTVSLIYKDTFRGNPGYFALSNMPTDGAPVELGAGRKMQKFQESVKMSTYLVCFIICDFDHLSEKTNSETSIDFTVYSPKGTIDQAKYALEVGVKIIEYYEKFFQVPYPLPKQDMIAIPDFPSGAMEHWGLITYRMTAMLYDKDMASQGEKQRVTTVVAHELAHMWFGNLVTMDWWDDLWLNEGFASFTEYLGVNASEPDFKILDQFLPLDMIRVMKLDSTTASHPIINKVTSPNQITELFDTITYSKGCSVIRMLEAFMGQKDFRNGVKEYLLAHKWGNAQSKDLWKALSDASPHSVDDIMSSWTKQSHYPLVTVKSVKLNGGNTEVVLEQEIFLLNPTDDSPDTLWQIPIFVQGSDTSDSKPFLMTKKTETLTLTGNVFPTSTSFLKLNAGQYGFFRVQYDEERWTRLMKTLKTDPNVIDAVDRGGILDDAFNLARAGKMSYEKALMAIEYLDKETNYVPWSVVSSALNYITENYAGPEAGKWRKFVASKAGEALKAIKFQEDPSDSNPTKLARPVLIHLACKHGNVECLREAKNMFDKWLADPIANAIQVNIRSQVYQYGMIYAGDDVWTKVHDRYKKSKVPQERAKLRRALAMPRTPWILERYIDYAKNEEQGIKSQDYFSVMELISNNPVGLPIVWDYLKSHWSELVDRFTINDRYFGRMMQRIVSNFNTDFALKDVEVFFAANPEAGAGARARKEGIVNIKDNIAWRNKFENSLTKWLNSFF